MLPSFENSSDLLDNALKVDLYTQLIKQLNKDFSLANFDIKINEKSTPSALIIELQKVIESIVLDNPNSFNHLLYIIDVPEKDIINSDIEKVTFLILKRTWKKVWFRNNYSS
ncbi:hypothetical protein H3Z83_05675 [Tenacibaculum sp. S7007]|uniref:Uncharacterized protein n=1 Tax=Tenacibaculum pelagium TaxID=2759527 RepID=A0A839AND5_9FLAO|nr:hypothetical protein [Tenacibaculum pelagium]MBA6156007.1 hypothetical protein [Tenacibaculum pelagium]